MKAILTQAELSSEQLSWLCIKPMLLSVRGMNMAAKLDVYRKLTDGQQALYLFYAYHNHAGTPEEFYWFAAYYVIEIRAWQGVMNSVRYFGEDELAELLGQLENVVESKHRAGGEWVSTALPSDMEYDSGLRNEVHALFERYRTLSARAIERMNERVLERPEEYIET